MAKQMARLKGYGDFTSPENANGIHLEFTPTQDGVTASFTIPDYMAGWRSATVVGAHPGAVDTVLSTSAGWAAMHVTKRFGLQKRMSVEYFDLVPVGTRLQCVGRLLRRRGAGEVVAEAQILDDKNQVLASCHGTFALFTKDELSGKGAGPGLQFDRLAAGACAVASLSAVPDPQ